MTGAFLAIPITAALIIACENLPATQWVATLATNLRDRGRQVAELDRAR